MEQLKENLLHKGASLVGFAKLQGTYNTIEELESSESNFDKDYRNISWYPFGVAIAVKIPKEVIKGITDGPTNDYYNAYHDINHKLDEIAMYCKEACPAHAIVGNVWRQGVECDCIVNVLKCRETARKIAKQAIGKEITLCGKCIVSCPFTHRYLKGKE